MLVMLLLQQLLLLLLCSLSQRSQTVVSAAAVNKGLYQATDHVTPLKFDELQSTIYSGDMRRHWLLQLYHSYCGHCINFAPGFKTFANNIKGWSDTVKLAVMDTADVANSKVMSHYGLSGVPSLLFIPSNTTWEAKFAASLDPGADLFDQLLTHLQPYVPQLAPLPLGESPSADSLLLEEANPGRLSLQLILDSLPGLSLRWRPGSAGIAKGEVRISRSNAALGQSASLAELRQILAPLRPASVAVPDELAKAAGSASGAAGSKTAVAMAPLGELQPPTVQDLRSGIIRALVSDAATVDLGSPGVWPAVRDFVRLLNSHLSPRSTELARLLRPLTAWLPESPPSHELWLRALADAGFPSHPPDAWVSCRGSKPYLRGYPCSLWQLFHTMTAVRFASFGASGPPVLPVMRRFIVACFSCRYCADNFNKGTADMEKEIGRQPDPGVELLYLWRKHNQVNKRLSGESSDDPSFPKARFPSAALCSGCTAEKLEAELHVVSFLVRWYGPQAGWTSHPAGFDSVGVGSDEAFNMMGFSRLDVAIVVLCFACALGVLMAVWCRLSRSGRRLCRRGLSPFRRSPSPV